MPVVRNNCGTAGPSVGLYQFLVECEEAEHHDWVTNHVLGSQPYGRSRRLAALRAGQPVTLGCTRSRSGHGRFHYPDRHAGRGLRWTRPRSGTRSGGSSLIRRGRCTRTRVVRGVHDGAPIALDDFLD